MEGIRRRTEVTGAIGLVAEAAARVLAAASATRNTVRPRQGDEADMVVCVESMRGPFQDRGDRSQSQAVGFGAHAHRAVCARGKGLGLAERQMKGMADQQSRKLARSGRLYPTALSGPG